MLWGPELLVVCLESAFGCGRPSIAVFCCFVAVVCALLAAMIPSRHVLPVCAILLSIAAIQDTAASPKSESLTVKDEKGNVRVRLGETSKGAFGWQILDEAGVVVSTFSSDGSSSSMKLGPFGGRAALSLSVSGKESVLEMSRDGWRAVVSQDSSGEMICGYYGGEGEKTVPSITLGFKPGDGGGARLRLGNGKDRKESVFLSAEQGGAGVQLSSGGQVRAQLATNGSSGIGYLLLGERLKGVFLQALDSGGSLLELCDGLPRVTLQSNSKGAGLGVDQLDGTPAIRIGVKPNGETRMDAHPK